MLTCCMLLIRIPRISGTPLWKSKQDIIKELYTSCILGGHQSLTQSVKAESVYHKRSQSLGRFFHVEPSYAQGMVCLHMYLGNGKPYDPRTTETH